MRTSSSSRNCSFVDHRHAHRLFHRLDLEDTVGMLQPRDGVPDGHHRNAERRGELAERDFLPGPISPLAAESHDRPLDLDRPSSRFAPQRCPARLPRARPCPRSRNRRILMWVKCPSLRSAAPAGVRHGDLYRRRTDAVEASLPCRLSLNATLKQRSPSFRRSPQPNRWKCASSTTAGRDRARRSTTAAQKCDHNMSWRSTTERPPRKAPACRPESRCAVPCPLDSPASQFLAATR